MPAAAVWRLPCGMVSCQCVVWLLCLALVDATLETQIKTIDWTNDMNERIRARNPHTHTHTHILYQHGSVITRSYGRWAHVSLGKTG